MMCVPRLKRCCARRGSAMVMVLVIAVIISGMVMTLAWAAGVQSQATGDLKKLDSAFYAAEAGIQRAGWYAKKLGLSSQTSPMTGSLNGCTYSVTWTTNTDGSYRVTSVATDGRVNQTVIATISPPVTVPAYTLGGGAGGSYNMKNLTINGDVALTGGVYSSGGNATVNGNLTYGTTYNGSKITVTGTVSQAIPVLPVIDYVMLKSKAGKIYNSDQSGTTFDFTQLSGTNKVIYVDGDVSNPTIIGAGTIVATGNISFSGDVGSSTTLVNLVAQGNVSNSGGGMTFYGSIYAGGNWSHSASFTITGPVTIAGNDNSGNTASGTMNTGPRPWFDSRTGTTGTLGLTNFSGPTP